jgi:hypothetical protein
MIPRLRSAISLFTCWCMVSLASATSANIGLVMTTGEVQVDGSQVRGNSTIFSGSVIASGSGVSSVRFSDGTSAMMNPDATMTVYPERSVLQQGVAVQRGIDKHAVVADGLRISGATPNAVALVEVRDASHIAVASQQGVVDVSTISGVPVAHMEPGDSLGFAIAQAAANQTQDISLCGKLGGNHQLKDSLTKVTYQLQGNGLEALVGKWVDVSGTINPSSPAPQVVTVSDISDRGQPCNKAGGAAVYTPGAIILVSLIALGGALIGIGAAVASSSSPQPVTPAVP